MRKKENLITSIKDFSISDNIHQLKEKKKTFLLENGFELESSYFQMSNDVTVEKWIKN